MDETTILGEIQGYLHEQIESCKKEAENLSEMTDEEKYKLLGKLSALWDIQIFVLKTAIGMLELE